MYQDQPLDLSITKNRAEPDRETERYQSNDNDDNQDLNDNSNYKSPKASDFSQEADIVDILLSDYYDDISNEFLEAGQELDQMIKMDEKANNETLSIADKVDSEDTCKLVIDENRCIDSTVERYESSEYDRHSHSTQYILQEDSNCNELDKESPLTSLPPTRSGYTVDLKTYQNKPLSIVPSSCQLIKNEEKASFILNNRQDMNSKNRTNLNEAELQRFQQIYFNLAKQYKPENLLQVFYIYSETDYELLQKHLEYFQLLLYHIFFGLLNDNSVVLTKQVLDTFFKLLDKFSVDNTKFWTYVIKTINSHYGISYRPSQKLQFLFEEIYQHLEERNILLNCLLFQFIFRMINPLQPVNIIKPLSDPYFCNYRHDQSLINSTQTKPATIKSKFSL